MHARLFQGNISATARRAHRPLKIPLGRAPWRSQARMTIAADTSPATAFGPGPPMSGAPWGEAADGAAGALDGTARKRARYATEVLVVDARWARAHLLRSLPPGEGAAPATTAAAAPAAAAADGVAEASLAALRRGAALLRAGEAVAMPTETVYGLAADATSAAAVARVFEAKGRPADNPLIVHVCDMEMLARLYPDRQGPVIPAAYAAAVARHWPGPLTILLPASPLIPPAVTAGHPTLAVRMPAHPVARALIAAAGVPLAAPSANTSGRPSPTTAAHVGEDLGGRVPLILDGGPADCGLESTVLDALRVPPVVLRPGGVTAEALAALPGLEGLQVYSKTCGRDAALEAAPTTPGMKYAHYAPRAPVVLLDPQPWLDAAAAAGGCSCDGGGRGAGDVRAELRRAADAVARDLLQQQQQQQRRQCVVVVLRTSGVPTDPVGWVGGAPPGPAAVAAHAPASAPGERQPPGSCSPACAPPTRVWEYRLGGFEAPEGVGRALFAALRAADAAGASAIVVEGVGEAHAGLAVMNRLRKAAGRVVPLEWPAGGR